MFLLYDTNNYKNKCLLCGLTVIRSFNNFDFINTFESVKCKCIYRVIGFRTRWGIKQPCWYIKYIVICKFVTSFLDVYKSMGGGRKKEFKIMMDARLSHSFNPRKDW